MVSRTTFSWLQRALIACTLFFLCAVAAIFIAGLFLPGSVEVQRVVKLKLPQEELHPMLDDLERWREWTVWGDTDEPIILEYSDPSAGVGAWYSWQGDAIGAGRIEITASDPARGVWYDMTFSLEPYPMKGALRYLPSDEGTELEWSLRGELNGPLERALGPILKWRIGVDFDNNLKALTELIEESE
jgi:hypothetical protein